MADSYEVTEIKARARGLLEDKPSARHACTREEIARYEDSIYLWAIEEVVPFLKKLAKEA